jgi:hypothetical protein
MSDIKQFIPPHENGMTLESQEYNPEAAVEKGIQELVAILHDSSFIADYVRTKTDSAQKALDEANAEYLLYIKKQIKEYIAVAAADIMGTTVEEGRKRGKEWGQALAQITKITVDGEVYPVVKQSCLTLEARLFAEVHEEFTPAIIAAEEALRELAVGHTQTIAEISAEVDARKEDPIFRNALAVWGRSPNAAGDWGSDQTGFHAGVIHYFEYRRDAAKAGRYSREESPFGVDGFITYSEPLQDTLSQYTTPEALPSIQALTRIQDEAGQERLILFTNPTDATKEGDLIVAFQRVGEPMLVISAVSRNKKRYDKYVQDELNPPPGKKKLNDLGAERTIVTQYTKLT